MDTEPTTATEAQSSTQPETEPTNGLSAATKESESTEKPQPRRSTRLSSASKPVVEEVKAPKKSSAPKKRTAEEVDAAEKKEENDSAVKKARGAKAKKSDESDEGLALGVPLPDLKVKSETGDEVDVKTLAEGRSGVVLFLVPKADTPGCTTQACGFRDIYPDFESLNFSVFCLSADSPTAQSKWKTKKSLPYSLLSDPERVLIAALTGSSTKTPRSHFVFADGKLADKKIPVKPADSPRLAVEFIKTLGKGEGASTAAPSGAEAGVTETETKAETTESTKAEEPVDPPAGDGDVKMDEAKAE